MIDIRKLKELVRLMVANELTELDLRDSEEQVTLRRYAPAPAPAVAAPPPTAVQAAPNPSAAAPAAELSPQPAAVEEEEGLLVVESPMVGTFYAAPDPDSSPFVATGSAVGPDTVVCIIEAMKIFNEIKAECSGMIQKVVVQNGESVEFGQPMFYVKP